MKPIPAQRKPLRGDSQKENLDKHTIHRYNIHVFGPVAQLGERSVRIREVESSSLFRSTIRELYERNTATEKSASPHLGSYFFVRCHAAKKRQTFDASASFYNEVRYNLPSSCKMRKYLLYFLVKEHGYD